MAAESLKFTITVDDKGTPVIKSFNSETDKMPKKVKSASDSMSKFDTASGKLATGLKGVITQVTALVGAAGFAALAADTVTVGAEFEKTMQTVGAVTKTLSSNAGEMTAEFTALNEVAREMGETTEWSATQAAEGLQYLGMAGFEATQAVEALPGVLDLATASNIELGRAADLASNALTSFQLDASELSGVNDVLIATITSTNTNMEMLADSMRYSAAKANAYGYSIEELSTMIGTLGNAGVQGTMAGTQLAFAFGRVSDVFEELGMDGTGKDLLDALEAINEAGWDTDQVMEAFGERGGRAALILKDLIPEVRSLQTSLEGATGEAKRIADAIRDTAIGSFKEFKSVLESIQIDIFDDFADSAVGSLDDLTEFLRTNREEITTFFSTIGQGAVEFAGQVGDISVSLSTLLQYLGEGSGLLGVLKAEPEIIEYGLVGLAIGGKKGLALGAAVGHLASWAESLGKALGLAASGAIEFRDVITAASPAELENLVNQFEAGNDNLEGMTLLMETLQTKVDALKKRTEGKIFTFASDREELKKAESQLEKVKVKVADLKDYQERLSKAADDTYDSYGHWSDGLDTTNTSAKTLTDTYKELYAQQKLIDSVDTEKSYDIDYGYDETRAQIDATLTAQNNLNLSILSNIDYQNRMKEAVDDTYTDWQGQVTNLDGTISNSSEKQKLSFEEQISLYDELIEGRSTKDADYWVQKEELIWLELETMREQAELAGIDQDTWEAYRLEQWRQYEVEKALASDDFFEGLKAGISDVAAATDTNAQLMYDAYVGFMGDVESSVSGTLSGIFKGEFDSIDEAFDSLCTNLLDALIDALSDMAAKWATSKLAEYISSGFGIDLDFGHEGIWDADEGLYVLLEGEMVVPEEIAEQIREAYGTSGDSGGDDTQYAFDAFSDDLDTYNTTGDMSAEMKAAMDAFTDKYGSYAITAVAAYLSNPEDIGLDDVFNYMASPSNFTSAGIAAIDAYMDTLMGYDWATVSASIGAFDINVDLGSFFGSLIGGLVAGPGGAVIGNLFGSAVVDLVGDALDVRPDEYFRDYYEDKLGYVAGHEEYAKIQNDFAKIDPTYDIDYGSDSMAGIDSNPESDTGGGYGSRPDLGLFGGGIIGEPIIGRGMMSGKTIAFGERGPEAVFNEPMLRDLSSAIRGSKEIVTPPNLQTNVEAQAGGQMSLTPAMADTMVKAVTSAVDETIPRVLNVTFENPFGDSFTHQVEMIADDVRVKAEDLQAGKSRLFVR